MSSHGDHRHFSPQWRGAETGFVAGIVLGGVPVAVDEAVLTGTECPVLRVGLESVPVVCLELTAAGKEGGRLSTGTRGGFPRPWL